jgi:hypothetical protein
MVAKIKETTLTFLCLTTVLLLLGASAIADTQEIYGVESYRLFDAPSGATVKIFNESPHSWTGSSWTYFASNNLMQPGQSFTPTENFNIGGFAFRLSSDASVDFMYPIDGRNFTIYLQAMSNSTDYVPDSDIAVLHGTIPSGFGSLLRPGQWIVFYFPDSVSDASSQYIRYDLSSSSTYSGGMSYYNQNGTWKGGATQDMSFAILDDGPKLPVCGAALAGDLNLDCKVNMVDLAELVSNWLDCQRVPASTCDQF